MISGIWCRGKQCFRVADAPAGHHLPGSRFPGLCHRNFLGNLRYSDSYLHRRIPCCRPAAHHLHLSLHGRSRLRRPYLAYQRYHHHGECRSRVQACASCFIAVAILPDSGWRKLPHLHRGWFHPYLGHGYKCHRIMDIRYIDARIGFILFK